jgi:hypothetical protein
MRAWLLAAAATVVLTVPALASECPGLWQQINEKMKTTQLSATDQAKLAELRKQGEDFHHAGKHDKSAVTLKEALALFGS